MKPKKNPAVHRNRVMLAQHPERGSIVVIVVLSLIVLLGFTGLAIDFGHYYAQKARMQAQADAAALACVHSITPCKLGRADNVAENRAIFEPLNFKDSELIVRAVDVICPHDPTLNTCVEVQATNTWDTVFVRYANIPRMTATATAIAVLGGEAEARMPTILALGRGQHDGVYAGLLGNSIHSWVTGDVVSNSRILFNAGTPMTVRDGRVLTLDGFRGNVNGTVVRMRRPYPDRCASTLPPLSSVSCTPLKNISSCGDAATYNDPNKTYCGTNWTIAVSSSTLSACHMTLRGNFLIENALTITISNPLIKLPLVSGLLPGPGASLTFNDSFVQVNGGTVRVSLVQAGTNFEMNPKQTGPYKGVVLKAGRVDSELGVALDLKALNLVDLNVDLSVNLSLLDRLLDPITYGVAFSSGSADAGLKLNGLLYAPKANVLLKKTAAPTVLNIPLPLLPPVSANDFNFKGVVGDTVVIANNLLPNIDLASASFHFQRPPDGVCNTMAGSGVGAETRSLLVN